jgi:hypothetical protein
MCVCVRVCVCVCCQVIHLRAPIDYDQTEEDHIMRVATEVCAFVADNDQNRSEEKPTHCSRRFALADSVRLF